MVLTRVETVEGMRNDHIHDIFRKKCRHDLSMNDQSSSGPPPVSMIC